MSASPSAPSAPESGLQIRFPPELPISARVSDIRAAVEKHQVVIVAGATGSGKTTQLPKVVLEMQRSRRLIGVTQPRRIAATSVAARVAEELECALGNEVGYQIRFDERTTKRTRVKFMTDGILLAEIQTDGLLRRYDTLIIDEAHERSLTIDFLLGWLKRILPERPDLRVIVSSATIETERFSEFFGGAPVIQVEGRTYPVEVLYEPPNSELDTADAVANAVQNVTSLDPRGDILVFLPGEREIRESEQELLRRNLRHTTIQPLYSRLSAAEQNKVFARVAGRRVILATNVAETSLTLPGIVYVIDTGVARLSRYDPRTGTTRLQIEGISQASAEQRKGRCGRVREGICVRLYDEESFAARPAFTDPEMKRVGLAGVILRMKSLGLGEVEDFPFIDAPNARSISEGYRVLEELGALDDERNLTPLGHKLARFPVDPRIGRMILAGIEFGCLQDILVLAAALNIQDPRERPRGLEQKVDALHQRFRDERSDFVGLLRLWAFVREAQNKSTSNLRRVCKDNFLSFLRVREWGEVYRQLEDVVRDLRIGRDGPKHDVAKVSEKGDFNAVHMALLSGLVSRIGQYNSEHRIYIGAKQTRFAIHPSSGLAKKPPPWVMAFELVQTSQLFARTVAKVELEWLDKVGSHLLKRSYSDPHWSEKSARASVREHATLFGLQVVKDRSVDYASISPVRARLMFIEHALVRGEYKSRGAFQAKNRALFDEVAHLRNKARKSDMLADDDALLEFFDKRVPESVVNGKTFETWRENAERKQPDLLLLSLSDVLTHEQELRPEDYPESIELHGVELPLSYLFEPTSDKDGITVTVPFALLAQLDPGELDWTIPAWHREKITRLLEELPKSLRRELGSIAELGSRVSAKLKPFEGPMLPSVSRAVFEETGVEIPIEAYRLDAAPGYYRTTCRVLDERGKVLVESRDIGPLIEQHAGRAREAFKRTKPSAWERKDVTSWDFGDLEPFVTRRVLGSDVRVYPAIVDRQKSVELMLLESAEAAEAASRRGIITLLSLSCRAASSAFAKRLPAPFALQQRTLTQRAETEAFREVVSRRIVQEAFGLSEGAVLPRSQRAFEELLQTGKARLETAFTSVTKAIATAASELEKTVRALDNASKQPSGKAAAQEVRAQLEQLFPADLLENIPLERLQHYPRYLRAAQVRLERAIVNPRKDADKAAPLAPLLAAFHAKALTARDQNSVQALRWAIEELRIFIFAPELKPAFSVSVATLSQAISALR
jgi:ATP-dependent helicase HrpA